MREEREGKGHPVPDWESENVATIDSVDMQYGVSVQFRHHTVYTLRQSWVFTWLTPRNAKLLLLHLK